MPSQLRRRFRLLALLVLYGAVAALALGTILAEFGERWWVADLLAHFRYHYALGALLLAGAALALGRRVAGLAAACLVGAQIWAVAAPPRTPAQDRPTAADTRLRVMSVNVLVTNPRHADVIKAIERAQPDVVALQEVSGAWHPVVARLAERLPHVAPADWRTQPSDNILLSRHPIVESRVVTAPGQYWFAHVEATLDVSGRRLRVLAVHPPLPGSPELTAIRQLHLDYYARTAAASDLPLLIVGDFNITPYSPRFRALLREGGLSYVHLGWAWPRSWPSANYGQVQRYVRGFPIDHVLTSRHFAATGARTVADVGSDHYPVVADLVLRR
jgi:endonuclease/exonuclease/phosphatase (EEP) superfamily protein YafD